MCKFNCLIRYAAIIIAVLVSLNIKTYGQDSTSARGKYALQFQIGSNFQLSSFDGATIAGKYTLPDDNVLRLGFTISGAGTNKDAVLSYTAPIYTQTVVVGKSETKSFGVNLSIQYLFYNKLINNIAFYFGGGPLVGISYGKTNSAASNGYNTYETITRGWNLGLGFSGGVDWFVSKGLSISAEYNFAASYAKTINNSVMPGNAELEQETTYGYQFGGSNVNLGVSFYF